MEILALQVAELWSQWVWPLLLLVIGLGLVIFLHELGHFVAAKWVGIKVERFALGFGPRVLGIRRGETDYCIKLLPLGGYVKMTGQEDFGPVKDDARPDPRSFMAKPIWARMLVASSGVMMNVVFAAVLFIVVCLVGIRFIAPRVGDTFPGYPAEECEIRWHNPPAEYPDKSIGLTPGDRIVSVNGRKITNYNRLQASAALAGAGETFEMEIARPVKGGEVFGTARIGVRRLEGTFIFGLEAATTLTFSKTKYKIANPLLSGDELKKFAGCAVEYSWEVGRLAQGLMPSKSGQDVPEKVAAAVLRNAQEVAVELPVGLRMDQVFYQGGKWRTWRDARRDADKKTWTFTLADGREQTWTQDEVTVGREVILSLLGMTPRLIADGVETGSPADKAGLEPGDIIVRYAGQENLTIQRLLDINDQQMGQETTIIVERDGQRLEKKIRPGRRGGQALIGLMQGVERNTAVVGAVLPGFVAAGQGVRPGQTIVRIVAQDSQGPAEARSVSGWVDVFNALRRFQGRPVTVEFSDGAKLSIPTLDKDLFDPDIYRVQVFLPPRGPLLGPVVRHANPFQAVAWGTQETYDFIVMTYATLRSWLTRNLPGSNFAGPVGMAQMAIQIGRKSFVEMVYFMAMISVSLAVINFLPLPVLDGGLAVLLLIEKVRRKPVPARVLNLIQMAGLALILFAFVALTWNDIARWLSGQWRG